MRKWMLALLLILAAGASQAALVEQVVDYQSGGVLLKGFLAFDDAIKESHPGVLVVHEWWGHNEYARERARMLARLGYVALAVDMYGEGKQAAHPEDAQRFSSEIRQNMAMGKARFLAAMEVLKNHQAVDPEHIAAIGYCFGGAIVLQMAREGIDLDAVVSFHGSLVTAQPVQPVSVKARVLVAHGGADPFVPEEHITGFIDEMNKAGADYKFIVYGRASHSFTNPSADDYGARFNLPLKYDWQADQDSWRDMRIFLDQVFGSSSPEATL